MSMLEKVSARLDAEDGSDGARQLWRVHEAEAEPGRDPVAETERTGQQLSNGPSGSGPLHLLHDLGWTGGLGLTGKGRPQRAGHGASGNKTTELEGGYRAEGQIRHRYPTREPTLASSDGHRPANETGVDGEERCVGADRPVVRLVVGHEGHDRERPLRCSRPVTASWA